MSKDKQDFLKDIIIKAGDISLEYRNRLSSVRIDRKSAKDLVTEADVAVEKYIVSRIRENFPSHSILGEETGSFAGDSNRWIIDPIDGTTSFVHKQPFYSVSIALEQDGAVTNAAVYAPVLQELFSAEKGKGSYLNDEKISVSDCDVIEDCMLATGFACLRSGLEENNMPIFANLMPKIRGIRRYGSAAIDACYVACGRLDGYWELNLNIYDLAAGKLILEEAGGICTDFNRSDKELYSKVLATNGLLHKPLSDIINQSRMKRL